MARERGWWDLDLHGQRMQDLSDADREHIAHQIVGGCTGGEINKDEEFDPDEDGTFLDADQVEINIKPKERG
jgi:hypothetical protein